MIQGSRRWFESLPVRGKLIVALAAQLAVLTAVCISFLLAQREVARVREWTNHTHLVIEVAEALRSHAIAQQTGVRGFVISGRRAYLDPYRQGSVEFEALAARLRELIDDNPQQEARLRRIEDLMRDWQMRFARPGIAAREAGETTPDEAAIDLDKRLLDAIKEDCAEMIDLERGLLVEREAELIRSERLSQVLALVLLLAGWGAGVRAVRSLHRGIGRPLSELAALVPRLANDDATEVPFGSRRDEVGVMSGALDQLRQSSAAQRHREWVADQGARLMTALQSGDDEAAFAEILLGHLCSVLDAGYGLAWRWDEESAELQWCGGYGLPDPALPQRRFRRGEGLIGQVLVDARPIELEPVPEGYLRMVSGLGSSLPQRVLVMPVSARGQIVAVLELGLLRSLLPRQRHLLETVSDTVGLAWLSLSRSLRTRELLAESQARARELHASQEALRQQQDKLQAVNEALRSRSAQLEEQGRRLSASEREQRQQAQELREANQALEERTRLLRQRQGELEQARAELERKAGDLERASRYKSEFLANMSHELRTPLNSMLILSRVLADNAQGNLDAEQVESARIVHDSGQSLLALINDILDLSKVEAGKMRLNLEDVDVRDCLRTLADRFRPLAAQRGLRFSVEIDDDVPAHIHSDGARVAQVLSNLLSNALKFTHQGGVVLSARRVAEDVRLGVRDSGIGIPQAQLARVFQAFEQADSGTSRRYGGTGLGLSIVSGMAALLGGEITASSVEGQGSEFVLRLPLRPESVAPLTTPETGVTVSTAGPARRPRALLIVEDDTDMSQRLVEIAQRRGLEARVAFSGRQALQLAHEQALLGVLLDIGLPDISGWEVLERLKSDPATRDLPVHIVSGREESERGLALGAAGFLHKPVSREALLDVLDRLGADQPGVIRRVLVADDDEVRRRALVAQLEAEGYRVSAVEAPEAVAPVLQGQVIDALAVAAACGGVPASRWLGPVAAAATLPPLVLYAADTLDHEARAALAVFTDRVIGGPPAGAAGDFGAVLVALQDAMPVLASEAPPRTAAEGQPSPATRAPVPLPPADAPAAAPAALARDGLAGHTVMVVDDDMRNVFALSKALRGFGLEVVMAQDGSKALTLLAARSDIELVLMDIMMPGMDGYEVIRRIREQPRWYQLPIIAVTAKAMKGDREKCLEAGANDYCAKPIDLDLLVRQLRQWL